MTLPTDSKARKDMPIARGNLRYFPDAHLAVAELSRYGNDKHNPGEELHWSKDKSNDHADCAVRHLLEPFGIDYSYGPNKPVLHSVAAAWRALANAQIEIEELKKQGKWPLATSAPAEPAEEAWRPHDGGAIPCPPEGGVQIKFRCGETCFTSRPGLMRWAHINCISDIVFWRPAK